MRRAERGAALAEAAVLFPALVAVVMGAGVATQLLLARLEVQEAARFSAWELTSYQVADVGSGDPRGRFREAARRVAREAASRYPLKAPFSSGTSVELEIEDARAGGSPPPPAWRLSPDGRADAVARARVQGVSLEERASVVVDPWNLPDGADAVVSATRAGDHRDGSGPSGLWLQVNRMKQRSLSIPDLRSAGLPRPDVAGPFVVSRGYRPSRRGACSGLPGYPINAIGGLEDLGDRLDAPQPRCFDTSPFRDTQEYAASLSAQMYRMRSAKEAAR
jgi:hypothetical protein